MRIYEQLVKTRPDAILPDLAMTCGARGAILRQMENHFESAASFAQGFQTLTPIFQKMPSVFAQLMGRLCQNYEQSCEHGKVKPDMALLAPVLEVFQKLKSNQPKE